MPEQQQPRTCFKCGIVEIGPTDILCPGCVEAITADLNARYTRQGTAESEPGPAGADSTT